VPEKQFYAGKLKFLDKLLSRPRFYLTDHFHDRLESPARANIERHIREVRENR
jgi:predicted metal-dependent HD superfamily phosphohydrolase